MVDLKGLSKIINDSKDIEADGIKDHKSASKVCCSNSSKSCKCLDLSDNCPLDPALYSYLVNC